MKKNILLKFILLTGVLFSLVANAGNKESFNNFEKFTFRMSNNPANFSYTVITGNRDKYPVQLNVGNYLAFMPSRYAAVNVYEFLSDTLQRDFKIIKVNKKGKVTDESKVIRYSQNDFFINYKDNVDIEKAELKSLGMVFAGVKSTNIGEYKITAYTNKGISGGVSSGSRLNWLNLVFLPTNSAFYIKALSNQKIVWSPNRDYNSIQYTFSVEDGKITAVDKAGNHYMSIYQKNNSLFVDMPKYNLEFRINQDENQLEYWINRKLKYIEKYQIM